MESTLILSLLREKYCTTNMKLPFRSLYILFFFLVNGPLGAVILFEEDFATNDLSSFRQVVRGTTPFSISSAGFVGSAAQVGDNGAATMGSGNQASGWLEPQDVFLDPQFDFEVRFQFSLVNEEAIDDAVFQIGNLFDGDFYTCIFNNSSDNTDIFYNEAFTHRGVTSEAYIPTGFQDAVWYQVIASWEAATQTYRLEVTNAQTAEVFGSHEVVLDGSSDLTVSLKDFTRGVQVGFGTFNDTARFDNIVIDGTAASVAVSVPGIPFEIANLDLEFGAVSTLGEVPPHWSFLWNPTGVPLGDVANYEPLTATANDWLSSSADGTGLDGNSANIVGIFDSGNSSRYNEVAYLNSGLSAANSSDGLDHYVILGYTIQPGQEGFITFNLDLNSTTSSHLRLYKGAEEMDRRTNIPPVPKRVTLYSGYVEPGETLYLAMLCLEDDAALTARRFTGDVSISTYNTVIQPNHRLTVTNHAPGHTIGYPLALIRGTCDPAATGVTISNQTSGDAPITWPALGGYYKGLVLLRENTGPNTIVVNDGTSEISLPLTFIQPNNTRRVNPLYYLASNSTGEFIAPSGEPNDIASAEKRISIMALLLQTFVAQSLADAGYEPRTFSLNLDPTSGLPVTQIFRTDRRPEEPGFDFSTSPPTAGVLSFSNVFLGQVVAGDVVIGLNRLAQNAAEEEATILDTDVQDLAIFGFTKYDGPARDLDGHVAVAIGTTSMYSSINLHTWAETLAEVPERLTDRTEILIDELPDDSSFRGTHWANYASAIGVCMHELGHFLLSPDSPVDDVFGLAVPHRPNTIMGRGGDDMGRFFTATAGGGLHPSEGKDSGRAEWNSENLQVHIFNSVLNKNIPQIDFSTWSNSFPGLTSSDLLPAADHDRDGIPNLLEFASGRNPTVPDRQNMIEVTEIQAGEALVSYERLIPLIGQDGGPAGTSFVSHNLIYQLFHSDDLSSWNPVQASEISPIGEPEPIGIGRERVNLRVTFPYPLTGFIRLEISRAGDVESTIVGEPSNTIRSHHHQGVTHSHQSCPVCRGIYTEVR